MMIWETALHNSEGFIAEAVWLSNFEQFLPFSLSWVKTLKLVALNDLPQVVEDHILGEM